MGEGHLMNIRTVTKEDYQDIYRLWESCNIELGTSDTFEEIEKFINMNPDTCLIGEEDGLIIGCVLGGYDGRRGLVHHLAVRPDLQGRGYGRDLLDELEERFRKLGVVKVSFWVKRDNYKVKGFYNRLGYQEREDLITMSKVL